MESMAEYKADAKKEEKRFNEFFKPYKYRDKLIDGAKCHWIGATTYPDLFTEEELVEIEQALDEIQEQSAKHSVNTSHNEL